MHITMQKAEFSKAFVHAVATVAGYKVERCEVDDDCVDLTLAGNRQQGTTRRAPRLDIQLKCTETDDGTGDALSFPLKMKNYDDLRAIDVHVPRILVVLCVPRQGTDWLHETPEQTAMRRVAYWVSIRGAEEVDNDARRTVSVPRGNRFTVCALQEIMNLVGEGKAP
jgi:hypothetical protein